MDLRTLSCEDVIAIHEALIADFAATGDPIAPAGVRSMDLLQSALSRQHTALAGRLKYPDAVPNAATLLYGICCDHPFHNGNKRTAIVAMLVHLDDNKLSLYRTGQSDLYDMVLGVAAHTFGTRVDPRSRRKEPDRRPADEEVAAIARWMDDRAERVVRGERELSYRDLRRVLGRFGFYLENPKGNYIDVVKYEEKQIGMFRKQLRRVPKRIGSIAYPGDHTSIGIREIKRVRQMCRLSEGDGYDSAAFYDRFAVIDEFVNRYRTLLRRLARR